MGGKRPPGKYLVDGKMLTVAEIAELMNTTVHGVRVRHSRLGKPSYQTMVDMYRAGQFGSKRTGYRKPHLIDGRWMSVQEVAAELGVNARSITTWRCQRRRPDGTRPTVEEAIEHFKAWKACGHVRSKPKVHRVKGRDMTVAEAAKMLGCTETALRSSMSWNKESLAATVKRQERLKARRAEKEILRILGF
jgi:hypothetical protein